MSKPTSSPFSSMNPNGGPSLVTPTISLPRARTSSSLDFSCACAVVAASRPIHADSSTAETTLHIGFTGFSLGLDPGGGRGKCRKRRWGNGPAIAVSARAGRLWTGNGATATFALYPRPFLLSSCDDRPERQDRRASGKQASLVRLLLAGGPLPTRSSQRSIQTGKVAAVDGDLEVLMGCARETRASILTLHRASAHGARTSRNRDNDDRRNPFA